jgi:F-type H+-transporting ATPase subunit delta
MADYQAGKRYAQAAFSIAQEQGAIAEWRSALGDIATVLVDSDASALLANNRVPLESRLAMLERMLDLPPLQLNLARLLVSKGRSAEARAVADAFGRMADQAAGVEHATVTTAVALSADQLAGIERQLGASLNKQVQATAEVDPSIVGGVVVRVGDKLLDGSVRTRLRQLRKELQGIR